jgi:hypothetical protein
MASPMPPAPHLNAEFLWECPVCHRPYRHPQRAADCACPAKKPLTVAAPLVRCSELPMFDGHLLALTRWLEADQAELARAAPPGRRRGIASHRLPVLRSRAGLGSSFWGFLHIPAKRCNPGSRRQRGLGPDPDFRQLPNDFVLRLE